MEPPKFEIDGIVATLPEPGLASAIVDYYRRNEGRYGPVGPEAPDGFWTREYWQERLARAKDELAEQSALRLFLLDGEQVVGHVNYTQFIRGPLQQCFLGYSLDTDHEGKGLLTRLLPKSNAWVFEHMHVHRIQANYLPTNERSGALLRRLGFTVEGYARDYLLLHGQWRDHIMAALTNPDWKPGT